MHAVRAYIVVGLGSALGGVARYACGDLARALWGERFPWGTIIINVVGSAVIGGFAELTAPEGRWRVGTLGRQFVMLGICGGYTTFSAFSLESFALWRSGRPAAAAANTGLSLVLCLLAVWLARVAARRVNE
jgi:CrcB protein